MAVSFDLFGTLVAVERPEEPAALVARELQARGVDVPEDWQRRYRQPQINAPPGAEVSMPEHVRATLTESAVETPPESADVIEEAVLAAFKTDVTTREGAVEAVRTLRDRYPVGILSNCSVPGLVEYTLSKSALEASLFDTVVTSVDCGWRKPDERAFEAVARELSVAPSSLVHVGDNPETDGGADAVGATVALVDEHSLDSLPAFIRDGRPNNP
ncbi:HAD family hydrolase [Halovenus salina]|uniref:HAD family hydrolase n=1 Tax=Halovenus salina TaxID=1510225 RepID=A0ABD5VV39_9EURY